MKKVFIIAEAGVNHNGSIETAKKMIDVLVDCKVDAIKFQTFKSENLVCNNSKKADYQIINTGNTDSQLRMLQKLELSFADFIQLQKYCKEKKTLFLSTPFDFESIDFLQSIDIPIWKVPSGEITNLPYLIKIAQTKKEVILSTGMSTLTEIEDAKRILTEYGAPKIALLHCNTEYPTPFEDVNLNAMITLQKHFNCTIGYSDHTTGIEVPIAAVALGAAVIEKHFTLDKNMEGPDHKASLEPTEFSQMVRAIRNIEQSLGDGIKQPSMSEMKNRKIARKSIIAKTPIASGEVFTEENITIKRPGTGISPMKWFEVLGSRAKKNYTRDELI